MKVVAFIPLRNNSQRIKDKNNQLIGNKSLVQHLTDTLIEVNNLDEIYIYSSDKSYINGLNEEIKFLERDVELDGNLILGVDIYKSFIEKVDADIYILAHVTSPFLKRETFENGISSVVNEGYDSSFTAERVKTFAWYKGQPLNYSLDNVVRTQDIEPVYFETSGFYIFKKELMLNKGVRIGKKPKMIQVDYIEAVDIDEPCDLDFARAIFK
ncbi:cytidylyltransferase domain-containing protein [Thalassomonas sp. M1454]|uniref:acylneuraminate cytidylyltransferase family protein n=1 Tax=Thalassomonas sp. M1454 TaxID=2594477 RepID=UPI00117E6F9E|nr:acylneuraminate cytidylyltransferase family protein [Thalassomonas sp. M1454]TRX57196.1 acylneuraminate cytidylyltransferase family protein [Thalassomonas sp. M1454]